MQYLKSQKRSSILNSAVTVVASRNLFELLLFNIYLFIRKVVLEVMSSYSYPFAYL